MSSYVFCYQMSDFVASNRFMNHTISASAKSRAIYLDANAGARLRPVARVALEQMLHAQDCGNPSSIHSVGRRARAGVSKARAEVSHFLSADHSRDLEIVFTSGGTEACNAMIKGFLHSNAQKSSHAVSTAFEHPAVSDTLLASCNRVTKVGANKDGVVCPEEIANALTPDTALVCVMLVNNETGVLQPVAEVARRLRERGFGGALLCDATQAIGKFKVDLGELAACGVSAFAISGHKMGALQGVGAVVLGRQSDSCRFFEPSQRGGGQESGFRSGTENVLGIVTLGAVCQELKTTMSEEISRVENLRDMFRSKLRADFPDHEDFEIISSPEQSRGLSNTLLVRLPGIRGDDLVIALDLEGVCASHGSACSSGKQSVSPALEAMGRSPKEARETVRFSLDWAATEEEIMRASGIVSEVVSRMKQGQLSS